METPRLSPSIAKILLNKSPKHAYNVHRLLGGHETKPSAAQIKGSAVDALVFGGEVPDCSKTVLAEAEKIAGAVKDELDKRGIVGKAQHRIEWTNSTGANCSGVVDLADLTTGRFWELKTCFDLSDYNIVKQIEQYGYDLQYAAYAEGLHATAPDLACLGEFIFVETSEPYDVRFVDITGNMKRNGRNLWLQACATWNECLRTGKWPGRGDFVADVSPYRKSKEAEDWLKETINS